MNIKAIPDGYHTITPYCAVRGVSKLIEFLRQAFGAEEVQRQILPDGTIRYAEVRIGDSMVMMGEVTNDFQPMPAVLYMYVSDVDAVYHRARLAGGKSFMEPMDQFFGDRTGAIEDPSGNQWWIATRKEDLSSEELLRRVSQQQ